jgi:crotonobetainyl-CoA:carnitine CoA-transferase CaiB-like acyl-CoA transferase
MGEKLLSGKRVLDLSRILAGPWTGQMLADLGAEVIKIERPGQGDEGRTFGPVFLKDRDGKDTCESCMYLSANRNKRSVTVDLSKPEGQHIVRELAAMSDVVLENYRVGTLAKYGLDYAALSALNPKLVYCSITGFGQTGPYRDRPGYDAIFQAIGGLMSVTGEADNLPGGGPMKVGPSIIDVVTALFSSVAVVSALYHRDAKGGNGQHIDMALLDSGIAVLTHAAMHYLVSGEAPRRRGTQGNGGMPTRMFSCSDGRIMISVGNNDQFARLCAALGLPALEQDKRFDSNAMRVQNRAALVPILESAFAAWKIADIVAALDVASVPAGPVNDMPQVFADPQVKARGMQIDVPHPLSNLLSLVANPIRFSETKLDRYDPPPLLGQHTEEVLSGLLGMAQDGIARLRATKII